jgi:hypothetical protein
MDPKNWIRALKRSIFGEQPPAVTVPPFEPVVLPAACDDDVEVYRRARAVAKKLRQSWSERVRRCLEEDLRDGYDDCGDDACGSTPVRSPKHPPFNPPGATARKIPR